MTYVELNDKYSSIIDTRGIRSMYTTTTSIDCCYLKIGYNNKDYYSYEYEDLLYLCRDVTEIKRKLGFL